MTTTDPKRTHYKVLMLAEHADGEIISAVYRKLAQRYHPDVDKSSEAAHRMAEINEAYAVLRDGEKRARYDAWLASRRDRRQNDRFVRNQGEVAYGAAGPRWSGPGQRRRVRSLRGLDPRPDQAPRSRVPGVAAACAGGAQPA